MIRKIRRFPALGCLLAILPVGAQQVRGPSLGFIVDSGARGIRSVSGLAGAATLGAAVDTGSDIVSASVSPNSDYVLAIVGSAREAAVWTPAGSGVRLIPGVTPGASRMVLSPEGTAAALYFSNGNRIQIVSGLPGAPAMTQEIPLTPLRSPLAGFAVSDDGQLVLCAEAADGVAVPAAVVLSSAGDLNRIPLAGAATALAFAPKSHDAVLVTGSEALLVRDVETSSERIALRGDDIPGATAAAFSPDHRKKTAGRIFFANADTGKVTIYDLKAEDSPSVTLDCQCQPAGLFRMGSSPVYRLTEYSGNPLQILDAALTTPRIVVIPPTLVSDKQP